MPAPASAAEISVSSLRLLLVDRRHTFPAAVEGRQKSNASRVQVALTSGVWSSKHRLHFVGSLTPSIPGVEYLVSTRSYMQVPKRGVSNSQVVAPHARDLARCSEIDPLTNV